MLLSKCFALPTDNLYLQISRQSRAKQSDSYISVEFHQLSPDCFSPTKFRSLSIRQPHHLFPGELKRNSVQVNEAGKKKLLKAKAAKRNYKDKIWTYGDIASAANVSESTVKRFFSGGTALINYYEPFSHQPSLNPMKHTVEGDN